MDPGAAHRSRTISVDWTSRYKGGSIDTSSCLEINPESKDFCKYEWKADRTLLFLKVCLFVFMVNKISPGYHESNSNFGNSFGSYSDSFWFCYCLSFSSVLLSTERILVMKFSSLSLAQKASWLGQLGLTLNTTGSFSFIAAQNRLKSSSSRPSCFW